MNRFRTEYLIVGQGLAGTWLSYFLLKAGKQVIVIDKNESFTPSKIASGVINPVTGRRIVRTWRIEELLPFAENAYSEMTFRQAQGDNIKQPLCKKTSVFDFHPGPQMKVAFEKRLNEEKEYLHKPSSEGWDAYFNYHFGIGEVKPCLLIDIHALLSGWRKSLPPDCLQEETFDLQHCIIHGEGVTYKNICAKKIIFCDGLTSFENPLFKNLPFAPNKGEALIVEIEGLPSTHIYKQGLSIVPWQNGLFWVGSSYEWSFDNVHPTASFLEKVKRQLELWLKLPFKIVDHIASVRPATIERRPFVGLHPHHPSVGILNGMGTKGCSLAPFFAKQLTDNLVDGKPIYPDADVKRFERVLTKTF